MRTLLVLALLGMTAGCVAPPTPGRVTLSNFSYGKARVQAVVTPYPVCDERPGTTVSEFEIPLNGTRIITAPPGSDVCWRREMRPGKPLVGGRKGTVLVSGWTGWSRVFTASGRSIDSRL